MFRELLKLFPIRKYKISGHSMEPTFREGDNLLFSSLPYLFVKPQSGDVIAFKNKANKKIYIKRIAEVKNGQYKVLGDNAQDSLDSRAFGWITKKDIIGRVIFPNYEFKTTNSK